MKIKRFVAADMRSAMNLVRREHGPEAVILSNRRVENGIEIVAAAHYDEDAMQRAVQAHQPPAKAKPRSAAEAVIAALTGRRKQAEQAAQPAMITTSAAAAAARAAIGAPDHGIELGQEAISSLAAKLPALQVEAPLIPEAELPNFLRSNHVPKADVPMTNINSRMNSTHESLSEGYEPRPLEARAPQASASMAPVEREMPQSAASTATKDLRMTTAPQLTLVPGGVVDESPQLVELRQEMAGMRQLIEREMARFTDERLRGNPVRAQAMDLMDEYGLDAGLARDIAAQMPADTESARARGLMLGLLSRRLPIAQEDPIRNGGIIALVGPTGAGKTTTIAKLASRFAAEHAARDIALVTTDTRRIGAREQLYGFGRQLGIAVHEAEAGSDLSQLLERLADYKLVLIDTAGMGQRDKGLAAQLQWLRAAGHIRTLLALPANVGFQDMDEVVRRFAPANPEGVVLTKLDETGRLGAALSIAVDHQLPITWVTDGQDVPADLQRASAANLVLRLEDLRRAADMPSTQEPEHAIA